MTDPQSEYEITDISRSRAGELESLTALWEASVRSSHHFLKEHDIIMLKPLVRQALTEVPQLHIAQSGSRIAGFMGIDGEKLEMLFLHPDFHGRGIGGALLHRATEEPGIRYIDVNEQNPAARGFYEHCGFTVFGRSPLDPQGNPFPILHMKKH